MRFFDSSIKKKLKKLSKKLEVSEDNQEAIILAVVMGGIGLPAVALLTAGLPGLAFGVLIAAVPGPHQPLALPILAASGPATMIGLAGASLTLATGNAM